MLSTVPDVAGARPTGPSPRIMVSARDVMLDERVDIAVGGLDAGDIVRLRFVLERSDGTWASQASFRADERGRVRVAQTAPMEGDYEGVDPMGLFWSAQRTSGTPPAGLEQWTERVYLGAEIDGREVATAELTRHYLRAQTSVMPVREEGLVGTLFEPTGRRHRPALIVLGGSEGGKVFSEVQAALLASHGYTALALAYFDPDGSLGRLPQSSSLIPLEYFTTAIDWLGQRRSVDTDRIGVLGSSRGAELALLLASRHRELQTVVAYAPSHVVWTGLSPVGVSAWSEAGQPVPFLTPEIGAGSSSLDWWRAAYEDQGAAAPATIPVERIDGPVLLISGEDDRLWPSAEMADRAMVRLRANDHPYPDRHLSYAGAGHLIAIPYAPTTELAQIPGAPPLGGNSVDAAAASRDQWPEVLRFLAKQLRG